MTTSDSASDSAPPIGDPLKKKKKKDKVRSSWISFGGPAKPEEEYFVDGMTEALIADLARVDGLTVISRTSTMLCALSYWNGRLLGSRGFFAGAEFSQATMWDEMLAARG